MTRIFLFGGAMALWLIGVVEISLWGASLAPGNGPAMPTWVNIAGLMLTACGPILAYRAALTTPTKDAVDDK